MPLRLIWYIFILICIFTFIGLNLGNTSDINLWFSETSRLEDVPIFISFFVMYIFGALSVIPFVIGNGLKVSKKMKQLKKSNAPQTPLTEDTPKKRSLLKKKSEDKAGENPENKDTI